MQFCHKFLNLSFLGRNWKIYMSRCGILNYAIFVFGCKMWFYGGFLINCWDCLWKNFGGCLLDCFRNDWAKRIGYGTSNFETDPSNGCDETRAAGEVPAAGASSRSDLFWSSWGSLFYFCLFMFCCLFLLYIGLHMDCWKYVKRQ